MIFSNKFSKFGKGKNISAFMPSATNINIYYYSSGIHKKNINVNNSYTLTNIQTNLPYNQVIEIDDNCYVTRLNKSLGIKTDEQ